MEVQIHSQLWKFTSLPGPAAVSQSKCTGSCSEGEIKDMLGLEKKLKENFALTKL